MTMSRSIYILVICCLLSAWHCQAQDFNGNKASLSNYIIRMYHNSPFEGVKVLDGNGESETFLISIVSLNIKDYPSEPTMNRVAEVKARSQASRYFNGANITSEMIVVMNEDSSGRNTSSLEKIRESSYGNIEALELLSTFSEDTNNDIKVFIYYSPICDSKTCKKYKKKSTKR